MPQTQNMTLGEKLTMSNKAIAFKRAGNMAEYERLMKSIPMPPYLAKFAKDHIGVEFLINGGWNLSEAEAEYGSDWTNN
jgi:hypothetical protein